MPSPTTANRASTWLRPEQVQRLRTACYSDRIDPRFGQRNEAIVTLLYDTGLHVGELVRLDEEDVDLDAGEVHVPETDDGETGATSDPNPTLPLDPSHSLGTVRLLKSYWYNRRDDGPVAFPSQKGGRLTPKAVRDVLTKAAAAATVRPYTPGGRGDPDDVSPQTLRHGAAWRLLNDEDRTIAEVRGRLRHTSRSTTRSLYGHLDPDHGDEAAATDPACVGERIDESTVANEILDSVTDLLYVFDTNGRFRWWNDRVTEVTGYADAAVASMHPLEFVPDEDTPEIASALGTVVEERTVETRESKLVTRDGRHVPYEFNGAPLCDDDGSVWGIVGVGRDISERRRATQAVERERERFRLFVDAVTDYAMFLLDTEGRIKSWNRGAERIKGYDESEIVGRHFSVLYPEEYVENGRPERLLAEATAEGRVEDEGWRVRKDGSRFWAHVTITALYDEGELRGFAKVTRDVTERRQREREIANQRDELERLNRINAVIRDVDQALVEATGRTDIERKVCDRITAADPYTCAWVGNRQSADGRLAVRAQDGFDADSLDAVVADVNDGDARRWPSLRALQTREVQVTTAVDEAATSPACRECLASHDCVAAVAVPILHRETSYGVLVAYTTNREGIGERQQRVFAELGETIGHAIAASERKEALVADSALEVTFAVRDPDQFFVRTASELGASLTLEGIARRGDDAYLEYFTVTGASPADVLDLASDLAIVEDARVVTRYDDECLVEVAVSDSTLQAAIAEYGGTVTGMSAECDCGCVRIELPQTAEVTHVVAALESAVDDVSLRSKRSVDRPIQTEQRFQSTVEDRLTGKQYEALEAAYLAGFFEQPRLSTGEEVAASLNVSASTFHQHIRTGLQKLLTPVLDPPTDDSA